jgi:hypothetical protein
MRDQPVEREAEHQLGGAGGPGQSFFGRLEAIAYAHHAQQYGFIGAPVDETLATQPSTSIPPVGQSIESEVA